VHGSFGVIPHTCAYACTREPAVISRIPSTPILTDPAQRTGVVAGKLLACGFASQWARYDLFHCRFASAGSSAERLL